MSWHCPALVDLALVVLDGLGYYAVDFVANSAVQEVNQFESVTNMCVEC